MTDWKPIETAPKEETMPFMVLVPTQDCGQVAVQVSIFEGRMYADFMDCMIDYDDAITTATHWTECMPLPQEPTP